MSSSRRAKYVGTHDAVVFVDPRAPGYPLAVEPVVEVEKGALTPAGLPDSFIESLLDQPANWAEHTPPKKEA